VQAERCVAAAALPSCRCCKRLRVLHSVSSCCGLQLQLRISWVS
jgi:hypothetical protein